MPLKDENPGAPLNARITLRVTKTEKKELMEFAELANISVSEVIRRCYFGKKITVNDNENMIKELRRQGGLMKKIHNESGHAYNNETAKAIIEMTNYIKKLRAEK